MVPSGIFKLDLSKRQKFVLGVTLLSAGIFLSEFLSGVAVIFVALILSILTVIFLFLALKEDIKDTFFYPIKIIDGVSHNLFYKVFQFPKNYIPDRDILRASYLKYLILNLKTFLLNNLRINKK